MNFKAYLIVFRWQDRPYKTIDTVVKAKSRKKPACYRQEKGSEKHIKQKKTFSSNEKCEQNSWILDNALQYVIVMCNFA